MKMAAIFNELIWLFEIEFEKFDLKTIANKFEQWFV